MQKKKSQYLTYGWQKNTQIWLTGKKKDLKKCSFENGQGTKTYKDDDDDADVFGVFPEVGPRDDFSIMSKPGSEGNKAGDLNHEVGLGTKTTMITCVQNVKAIPPLPRNPQQLQQKMFTVWSWKITLISKT